MSNEILRLSTRCADFGCRDKADVLPLSVARTARLAGWGSLLAVSLIITGCDAGPQHVSGPFLPEAETYLAGFGSNTAFETGHDRMLNVLLQIALQTDKENPDIGEYKIQELRERLASLPPDTDDSQKSYLRMSLSREELRLGNENEAIVLLQWIHDRMPSFVPAIPDSVKNEVRFRLGLAHLRRGETQNCCLLNTPESCILPIRGKGLHQREEGSREAIKYFSEVLENTTNDPWDDSRPQHRRAIWLLNIAYMTIGGYPQDVPEDYRIPPTAFSSKVDFPSFENIASALKLNTFDMCGSTIVEDFDNDGDLDIVTSSYDTKGNMHYFQNNADGTFADQTEKAGLIGLVGGLNMVQADYNNDGLVDILVMRGGWFKSAGRHPNSLLRNQGDGTFRDVTFEAGLGEVFYPTQTAAWSDYDHDGDLDLYVGNEHLQANEFSAPGQLFRNNGDETFTDVAKQAGVENFRFAKGVVWGDYDNDRYPDLYVSNLGEANRLYHNNGDGTFTDVSSQLGVDSPRNSFPAWFWDVNNDGVLDLFVSSYSGVEKMVSEVAASYLGQPVYVETCRLYRGSGDGRFIDATQEYGLTKFLLPMGANFGDLNGDGFLDFYLGTGYPSYEALMPNVMYLNQAGRSFVDVTSAGRFGHLQKGHGIAFADLDHDGDQDVFEQMGGAFPGDKFSNALYQNPGFGNHWLSIQLVGKQSNRSAIGARIKVTVSENGQKRSIFKHINSGGSFGGNPLRQTIGLGKAEKIEQLEVYWPTSDRTQRFDDVTMDQCIRIEEDTDHFAAIPYRAFTMPVAELALGQSDSQKAKLTKQSPLSFSLSVADLQKK